MNEELQDLEAELLRLRPRAPSELTEARVQTAMAKASRRKPAWRQVWRELALAGVAAAVAFLAALPGPRPAGGALQPVLVNNEVKAASDDGVVTLDDGTTAWRTRIQYVDTVCWSDGGRTLTLTAPREELRLVPLVAY